METYNITKSKTIRSNMTGTMFKNQRNAFLGPEEFNNHRTMTAKLEINTQLSLNDCCVV